MESLSKTSPLPIRFNAEQRKTLRRAARIVSRERREVLSMSAFVRESAMEKADAIISATEPNASAA